MYLKLNGIELNCTGRERWGDLLAELPDGGAGALGISVQGRTCSLNDPVEEYTYARVLTYADEEGRRVYERVGVDPAELKKAVDSYEYLVMHRAFVKRDIEYVDKEGERRTFNSVTFAPGTAIGDQDLSNAQMSPFSVIRGYRTQEVEVIPLPKDRPVLVNIPVEEDGHLVHKRGKEHYVEVKPSELVAAAREQRRAYVAAQKEQGAGPIVEEVAQPELYDHDIEFGPEKPSSPRL